MGGGVHTTNEILELETSLGKLPPPPPPPLLPGRGGEVTELSPTLMGVDLITCSTSGAHDARTG
jgi:hypothetical protein